MTDPDQSSDVRFSLVDDATAVRESLAVLLPDLTFVSSHPSLEDFLAAAPRERRHPRPAPGQPAPARRRAGSGCHPRRGGCRAPRVRLHPGETRFVLASCLAAGAAGVVSKSSTLAETRLAFSPRRVAAASSWHRRASPASSRHSCGADGSRCSTSARSAGRAGRGLTYAELSRTLYLSESTLRGYWRDLSGVVSSYLQDSSPGDIEQALGLGPGDLVDHWPTRSSSRRPRLSRRSARRGRAAVV